MKNKSFSSVLALFLGFCLLFTACNPLEWLSTTPKEEAFTRNLVPFSQMEYKRPDVEGMSGQLKEYAASITDAKNFDDAWAAYQNAVAAVSDFSTMYSLANLRSYHDVTDKAMEEEYRFCKENSVTIDLASNQVDKAVVESRFVEEFRKKLGDYYVDNMETQLLLFSPEVEEYQKERRLLEADYDNLSSTAVLTVDGNSYTFDQITQMEDYMEQFRYMKLYYAQNADAFANIYARMVELDKLTAETLNINSPAEMYYLQYSRDYTPQVALEIAAATKEYLVPVASPIISTYVPPVEIGYEQAFDAIPPILAEVSPDMETVWKTMVEYELTDYENLPDKQKNIAFTTTLPNYDVPFCFGNWDDTDQSASTVIHEYGHFYSFWTQEDKQVVLNLDIAELYSQGLEMLAQSHWQDITGNAEDANYAKLAALRGIANALVYQVLLEEFQIKSYELETINAETLGVLFAQLEEEYGLSYPQLLDSNGADHSWNTIPHLFNSPFYTISYATSANLAMQIWSASLTDWNGAAQTYLDLLHSDQNQPFTQWYKQAGLRSPMDPASMRDIASKLNQAFSGA